MLFSTKAEYGIRLMVALGRREGDPPVALAALADSETLPLSYLEHLVAKLRDAGLVTSQRGAHGGYRLAQPGGGDPDARGGRGARGADRPDGLLHARGRGTGRICCSHEADGDVACSTKLLWTRVQGGITRALAGTTLPSSSRSRAAARPHRSAPAPPERRHRTTERLESLTIG